MSNNTATIVNRFVKEIQNLLKDSLKKVILYGSYARGDYNKSSDIDIMILTNLSDKELEEYRDKISDIAFDIELDTGCMLSPIIKNVDKFNIRTTYIPFYKNVKNEGVVLVG